MILFFIFLCGAFNLNAMDFDLFGDDYCPIWSKTKQKLIALGMSEIDLDESVPKDYPLDKLELTNFWKVKKQSSQDGKNKLLAKILLLPYADKCRNVERLHIAATVMIGADPDTREFYLKAYGSSALENACIEQDIPLASLLLKKGADPNIWTGIKILWCAFYHKNEQLARLLLSYGADPEKQLKFKVDAKKWCQKIQQIQKEQEELQRGLIFQAAKVLLKHQSIGIIKNLPIPPPTDVIEYLEKTKKMLN